MAESELSGNTISKGQGKSRKTSTESSQSPKVAQPSCLRGAFIRIFLKRAEPNNRTEEDPSSNQNTEDQEEVRGKKRRVTASIFRLPCLRPAETTGNDIQDKTEEQSSDVIQEEELKPYSKASFLRKIRCYRLMREKDASEKDKVIEMAQRKHDKENAEVKRYKEKVLEQTEEGLQSINHDEVVGEKGKDPTEQAIGLGAAGNNFQEQDFKVEDAGKNENNLRKQECCTGKLSRSGEESMKMEDSAQSLGGMGIDLTEQESPLSVLLEGEVSLLDDKNLAEQEDQMGKVELKEHLLAGVGEQKEDMLEEKTYAEKVRDLDNALSDVVSQPEEVGKQEKQEEAKEKDSSKQEGCDIVITNTEESVGAVQKYLPENKCRTDELGDSGNYLSEQEVHTEKAGNAENNLEDIEDTMNCLAEQDGQKEMKGFEDRDMTQDSQGDIADKMENNVLEKESGEESHVEIGGGQENNLVDQDSHTEKKENSRKETSQQDIVKDGPVADFEDNTVEIPGVSLDDQNEQISTNEGFTRTILNQKTVISETSQLQDSSAERTLGSEDNEELLASIMKKTTTNNTVTCTSSEEAHKQVIGLQKEVLTSTNAMDLTHQEPHILHTSVNNEDDGKGCENADLGTLRVEVKDMVEWMVQEASDRLSNYAQDSEGTG